MALEERAMLVRLSISQWYNRALDRKVAEEVATKYEVSSTDSQDLYIKTLLPKVAMRNVNRAISELRTFHYAKHRAHVRQENNVVGGDLVGGDKITK